MIHIEIDPMFFLQAAVDEQAGALETADALGPMLGSVTDAMAVIAWEHLALAQTELDRLIAEDTTWK